MGNLKYNEYAEDTANEEAEDLASSNASFMKLKEGRNIIRILPAPQGQRSPFNVTFQHFVDIAGNRKSVICAKVTARKRCLVCEKIDELRKSKSQADQEMASALYARRRIFCNVIDRAPGEEAKGPKILGFGKSVHEQLVALRTDPTQGGDYVNPESGYDVVITRTGHGKNDTKYHVGLAKKETPLERSGNENIMQEWIDNQPSHEQLKRLPEATELKQLLSGEEVSEDEEEEEEEAPPKKAPPAAAARRTSLGGAPKSSLAPKRSSLTSKKRSVEDDATDYVEAEVVED